MLPLQMNTNMEICRLPHKAEIMGSYASVQELIRVYAIFLAARKEWFRNEICHVRVVDLDIAQASIVQGFNLLPVCGGKVFKVLFIASVTGRRASRSPMLKHHVLPRYCRHSHFTFSPQLPRPIIIYVLTCTFIVQLG
jgi:hypothetical protein